MEYRNKLKNSIWKWSWEIFVTGSISRNSEHKTIVQRYSIDLLPKTSEDEMYLPFVVLRFSGKWQ